MPEVDPDVRIGLVASGEAQPDGDIGSTFQLREKTVE